MPRRRFADPAPEARHDQFGRFHEHILERDERKEEFRHQLGAGARVIGDTPENDLLAGRRELIGQLTGARDWKGQAATAAEQFLQLGKL
jgi:hypothetical protein